MKLPLILMRRVRTKVYRGFIVFVEGEAITPPFLYQVHGGCTLVLIEGL